MRRLLCWLLGHEWIGWNCLQDEPQRWARACKRCGLDEWKPE